MENLENHAHALNLAVILLGFAVITVAALRRVKLPPILAYLFTGMLVGPYGLAWITNTEETRVLAEYGVVFLLFTLGLEFSLSRLMAMKRDVLVLGGGQVLTNAVGAGLVAWLLGASPQAALAIGGALAMSSTAIVIKQLKAQSEIGLRHGRLSVAVLLFQDLAVIPFLILIPALGGAGDGIASTLLVALGKGVLALALILAAGRWLLRPLFHEIASARLAELFTLAVLLFTLVAAWLTAVLGLSLALGAFLAGIMLGETEFRHQVELEIRPFRDVLLGLFFVTVGMLVNVGVIVDQFGWVMLAAGALIAFKTVSVGLLSRHAIGTDNATGLRTGLVLGQGGEFGFALLTLGLTSGLLSAAQTQFALAVILITMIVSPLLIGLNRNLGQWLFKVVEASPRDVLQHDVQRHSFHAEGHTIIAGYGRVGQNVARMLEQEGLEYIALDMDPVRVKAARDGGDPVFYGDATHPDILEAVGLEHARALVVSYHDVHTSLQIIKQVRRSREKLPVLVRTRDDSNLELLLEAGATEVIPEALEASLMVASHLLVVLDVPVRRVLRRVEEVRQSRYGLLRNLFRAGEAEPLDATHAFREELHTLRLGKDDHAVDRRIEELPLTQCGVMITALRRHGIVGRQPARDTLLHAGDTLVLYGTPEDLTRGENLLRHGSPRQAASELADALQDTP